tara:strand:- start:240 stop:452 length:213 start_codon:yes stop_codon:yes gene_type:complete
MICPVKVGSAWAQKETGDCIIVVSANRTGHQYDRHWLLEVMKADGSIRRIEDYSLFTNYDRLESQELPND